MLDIATLLVASAMARTGFVLIFVIASFVSDTRSAFRCWTLSIVLSAMGMVLSYASPNHPFLPAIYGTVVYILLGFSIACFWAGGRAFFGLPIRPALWAVMGIVPGLTYGLASVAGFRADLVLLLTICPMIVSLLASSHALLSRRVRPYLSSQLLVGITLNGYGLALVGSVIGLGAGILQSDAVPDTPTSEIYIALFIDQLTSVLIYVGLVAMSLESAQRRTRAVATTDSLTGLANRRGVHEMTLAVIAAGRRAKRPLAVLLMDLDHFKAINDRHGHAAGDTVLKEFANRLTGGSRREQDVLGRWGGEEFLAVLSDTDESDAIRFSELVCRRISESPVAVGGGRSIRLTVSIGVAVIDDDTPGLEEAVRRADEALYEAKRNGRNRVVMGGFGLAPAAA